MASVLACGADAVLSHCSAAGLWGLQRRRRETIEVTTPRSVRSRRGIRRHCAKLPADEITERRGIAVTTVSRTLLDLAATIPTGALELAVREAEVRRLPLRPPLVELFERHRRRRGIIALRSCLERLGRLPAGGTRSRLEDRFLALIATHDLPRPQTNVLLDLGATRIEADCLWRRLPLAPTASDRGTRRPRSARHPSRLRERPRAGSSSPGRWVDRRAGHLAADRRGRVPPRRSAGAIGINRVCVRDNVHPYGSSDREAAGTPGADRRRRRDGTSGRQGHGRGAAHTRPARGDGPVAARPFRAEWC